MEKMNNTKDKGIFKVITGINIIVFIITFGGTNIIGSWLGNNYVYTIYSHQYYRLISCIFLHYGMLHLIGNTISFIILDILTIGLINRKDKYFIYMSTGVLSSLASALFNMLFHRGVTSAGASGAICGLIGAFVAFIHGNRTSIKSSLLFIIITLLLIGIRPGVDNISHISGIIFGFIFYKKLKNS